VQQQFCVVLPHWMLLALTIPLPAYLLIARLRRHERPGYCRTCGYDLRATPDRCPECGAISEGSKGAAT
jgi:hypothetical protein